MKIIHGDCLEEMRKMEENSISCIVTDPPYGLKFMGKEWDHGIPGVDFWKEALRISKPGTWMLAFGGTRTYHRLTCAIEDAGWEIRDCIMWIYGSGFPKGKGCLKPAYEPIILARKKAPKPELNIDECRIGFQSEKEAQKHAKEWDRNWTTTPIHAFDKATGNHPGAKKEVGDGPKPQKDRWPANILFDEEAAKMLNEQSGPCKTGDLTGQPRSENKIYGKCGSTLGNKRHYKSDAATGASRFFYCAKTSTSERNKGFEGLPLKDAGIKNVSGRGFSESDPYKNIQYKNHHPTVKPLKLMEYLIKLVMPKEGLLLDPFAGSGSTLLAAKNLGVEAIGIEKEEEYCKIAEARIFDNQKAI